MGRDDHSSQVESSDHPSDLSLPFNIENVGGSNEFISPFGIIRHSRDKGHGHGGIDIPLNENAPVYAVADVTILSSEKSSDGVGGFDIKLLISGSGGEGWGFLYEHVMLVSGITVGSKVTKGQLIARNGLTTDRRNNHLQLSYMFNDYTFFRDQRCWVNYLDPISRKSLLAYFDSIKTTEKFIAQWETASEGGTKAYKKLLNKERYPEGPQLCYPLGLDVRVPTDTSSATLELTPTVTHLVPTATPSPTPIPTPSESEEFWNRAMVGDDGEPFPSCGHSIFTHPVVDPEDATSFFWESYGYPHDHMVYWSTRQLSEKFPAAGVPASEQVQLYAPADIYFMNFGRTVLESHDGGTFEDWGIYTIICEGYSLFWAHVGRPIDEILNNFRRTVPVEWTDCPVSTTEEALVTTEVGHCRWNVFLNPPINAGTPIWKSSGYSTGFDLGLQLFGLTAEELQQHPSYGYSINPWVHSGGNSVCTLEYFPEPYRTAYLESMPGRCGPINQDVPGTAMGMWLPIPPPADGSIPDHGHGTIWDSLGEGDISGLYLYEDWLDESVHKLNIGSQLPDIPTGMYRIETVSDGLVNREWNSVVPGEVYCAELRRQTSVWGSDDAATGVVLVEVSEDGRTLTIEGITRTQCGEGPYSFSTDAHTMYR